MKEQLREEIERIWYRMQSPDGGSAELEKLSKLTVILRDMETADSAVAAARLADAAYHLQATALRAGDAGDDGRHTPAPTGRPWSSPRR